MSTDVDALRSAEQRRYERGRRDFQFAPEGDNHHNAALCPYCSAALSDLIAERDQLRDEHQPNRCVPVDDANRVLAEARAERDRAAAAVQRVKALCDEADDQPDGFECRFIATDLIRLVLDGEPL